MNTDEAVGRGLAALIEKTMERARRERGVSCEAIAGCYRQLAMSATIDQVGPLAAARMFRDLADVLEHATENAMGEKPVN